MPMRLKAVLIAFFMLSYITAPVIDAVACDDCADPVTLQREAEKSRILPGLDDSVNHDGDHAAPFKRTAKDLCPICANAAAGNAAVNVITPREIIPSAGQPKLLVFFDPSFPITKPPQN